MLGIFALTPETMGLGNIAAFARRVEAIGFDGLYVKRGKDGKITELVINESKWNSGGTSLRLEGTVSKGEQMSEEWVRATIQQMVDSTNPAVAAGRRAAFSERPSPAASASRAAQSGLTGISSASGMIGSWPWTSRP